MAQQVTGGALIMSPQAFRVDEFGLVDDPIQLAMGAYEGDLQDCQYISSTIAGVPIRNAAGSFTPTLGREGIATAFYGNPRQVLGTFTAKF